MNSAPSSPPPAIETHDLTRTFDSLVALDHVSLSILPGEFFSLLGPSGCGKTTLLRLIAGLEVPTHGRVLLHGLDVTDLPAHRRPVNTVFQSYALFPHLDVHHNVAFGLKMKGLPATDINRRVAHILDLVQISDLAQRRPAELSGGQKQRVALARAIVNEPQVLLLDEPLAALDLKLRKQLQLELHQLQRRLRTAFVYVTHDQEEALTLSDRIAVMRAGRIEQIGSSRDLYEHPRTRFVADFVGSCTLIDASAPSPTDSPERFLASTPLGILAVAGPIPTRPHFTLAIRPEKIRLSTPNHPTPPHNLVPAQLERHLYVGSETHLELRAGPILLRVQFLNSGDPSLPTHPGQTLHAFLPPEALVTLED